MGNKTKQTEQRLRQWLHDNREQLPLNIDSWKIVITEKDDNSNQRPFLNFGKYNAVTSWANNFYKPYSRIVKVKNG